MISRGYCYEHFMKEGFTMLAFFEMIGHGLKAIGRFEYSSQLFVGLLLLNIVLACLFFG